MVGISLAEWTAQSISPDINFFSISSVNSPLPPISVNVLLVIRSPLVDKGIITILCGGILCTSIRLERVSKACAKASGLQRVPILKGFFSILIHL
ncbi:hypothetical protein FXW22_04530 [Candidatus Liberibacter asiaticus]|nr:hypothetical protein FXW22_04530 [Candidatus Liberibacter asiaticus]